MGQTQACESKADFASLVPSTVGCVESPDAATPSDSQKMAVTHSGTLENKDACFTLRLTPE